MSQAWVLMMRSKKVMARPGRPSYLVSVAVNPLVRPLTPTFRNRSLVTSRSPFPAPTCCWILMTSRGEMTNACNNIKRHLTGLSFVILSKRLVLLRNELSHSDQDQTRSGLDRIRHDQGFPNLLRKMASWGGIFRNKFGKSGQDQTRSGLPKFVTENGQLRGDFP